MGWTARSGDRFGYSRSAGDFGPLARGFGCLGLLAQPFEQIILLVQQNHRGAQPRTWSRPTTIRMMKECTARAMATMAALGASTNPGAGSIFFGVIPDAGPRPAGSSSVHDSRASRLQGLRVSAAPTMNAAPNVAPSSARTRTRRVRPRFSAMLPSTM